MFSRSWKFYSRLTFFNATSLLVRAYKLVLNPFYLLLYSFLASQGNSIHVKRICASGWFVRIENTNCTLRIMFQNVLRIFEVEILEIFKNIQPHPET